MSRLQAAGDAAIAAATLHAGSGDLEGFKATFPIMLAGILNNGGDPVPAGNPAIAQAQANLAGGGVAAAPTVSFKNDSERWQDALINNPGNWYNNVGDPKARSGGGRGPDFRHKQDSDQALFLNGKYGPAEPWVFEKLGLPNPAAPAPAAQPQIPTGPAPF